MRYFSDCALARYERLLSAPCWAIREVQSAQTWVAGNRMYAQSRPVRDYGVCSVLWRITILAPSWVIWDYDIFTVLYELITLYKFHMYIIAYTVRVLTTKILVSIREYLGSVQFSHSVMSDSLWPHGLEHTRLPCPYPAPRACSNSCPSSQWCHPTISSSVIPFSSCPQSCPASGSFQANQTMLEDYP